VSVRLLPQHLLSAWNQLAGLRVRGYAPHSFVRKMVTNVCRNVGKFSFIYAA
jgi:hypothetical protein